MAIDHTDIQIQAMANNLITLHGLAGVNKLIAALVTSANYQLMTSTSPGAEGESQVQLDVIIELYDAWKKIYTAKQGE